jgi:putative PIN family toxin of toxin-antitoxin system
VGKEPPGTQAVIRAVLDTNVLISALLFTGSPARLVPAWQSSRLRPVVSADILDEYVRVLAYPKFELTPSEIRSLIEEELLPYVETVQAKTASFKQLRDPDDAKFIACALAAGARWLVSGDADLRSLRRVKTVEIVPVATFLQHLKRTP